MRTAPLRVLLLLLLLFLYGCISLNGMNCDSDKQCLQEAFKTCERAYGIWKNRGGNTGVKILEKQNQNCKVEISILEQNLEISNRTMTCLIPPNTKNFSIDSDCKGSLRDSFA